MWTTIGLNFGGARLHSYWDYTFAVVGGKTRLKSSKVSINTYSCSTNCIHIEITTSSWVAKLPPLSPSAADDDDCSRSWGFVKICKDFVAHCAREECYGFPTNMETPITSDSQSGVRTHCLLIATKNHYSLRILDERSKYLQRLCLVSLKISQDIKLKKYLHRLKKT